MRTPLRLTLLAAGLVALSSSSLFGAIIDWDNNYRTGVGGEFTLVDTGYDLSAYTSDTSGIIGADSFQTFCIEYNEYISKGQQVNVSLSSSAVMGGANTGPDVPGGNPDPVSIGTAYLYSQFAAGTLAGYDYSLAGRQASAGQLQNAIWYLEGERSLTQIGGSNDFVTLAINMFGAVDNDTDDSLNGAARNANGDYNVSAVNIVRASDNYRRQDQLYVAPGGVTVPDGGASALLLGLALVGLAGGQVAIKRKKN